MELLRQPYCTIHDEADAIMHHSRQVSAVNAAAAAHVYNGLRLLPGPALEAATTDICHSVADALLSSPPHELRWLREAQYLPVHSNLRQFFCDASVAADRVVSAAAFARSDDYADALVIRGLLAHGRLLHCLQKRHRVDYGVPREPWRTKRLAVPFIASDTPSPRSEFADPDVALLFTTLAYQQDGLSELQLREAITALQKLGLTAQQEIYGEWVALVECAAAAGAAGLPASDERMKFDNAAKLDVCNTSQVALLHRTLGRCTAVADFWLANCVFPRETRVFPHRLLATPWTLAAASPEQIGFSGTDDSQLLLPAGVAFKPTGSLELRATNGHMLAALLAKAAYEPLPPLSTDGEGSSLAHAVFNLAVARGARAIIDAGALLAGRSNAAAATDLLKLLPAGDARYRGVAYFSDSHRGWVVRDRHGRTVPLASSPIPASSTMALFDQARSRGADLKLAADALAVLTLSAKMQKDALMQAAGRMRGISDRQQLLITAPSEVHALAQASAVQRWLCTSSSAAGLAAAVDVGMREVMEFVLANSAEAAATGLLQWASHGWHHAYTSEQAAHSLLDDTMSLAEMYGRDTTKRPVAEVAHAMQGHWRGKWPEAAAAASPSKPHSAAAVAAVEAHLTRYGRDVTCEAGTHDEECERELEKEVEAEEDVEREVYAEKPAAEAAFSARAALIADKAAGSPPIQDWLRWYVSRNHSYVNWGSAPLYATTNFMSSVDTAAAAGAGSRPEAGIFGDLSEFTRPPDAMLAYPDGSVLLLSEREADEAASQMWKWRLSGLTTAVTRASVLVHLQFAHKAASAGSRNPRMALAVTAANETPFVPPPRTLAALRLLAGETSFPAAQRAELARLILGSRGAEAAEGLCHARDMGALFERSDLQEICRNASAADRFETHGATAATGSRELSGSESRGRGGGGGGGGGSSCGGGAGPARLR